MPIRTTKQRLGSPERIVRFFALVMGLIYLALGGWLIYTAGRPTPVGAIVPLGHTPRLVLGIVFALYGLYRTISNVRAQFNPPPADDHE